MAIAAVQFGVPSQHVALAHIRFLAVVRGGLQQVPLERKVEQTYLSELEEREDAEVERALRDETDCFHDAEREIIFQPLRDFLLDLPESQRDLVHLLYWKGLSQAEVARRRGWHPMKVNRELQATLARARAVLTPHKLALLAA